MSRTTRDYPHRWWSHRHLPRSVYIDREMNDFTGWRWIKTRLSEDEYQRRLKVALDDYEARIKAAKKALQEEFPGKTIYVVRKSHVTTLHVMIYNDGMFSAPKATIYPKWVNKFTREKVDWSEEDARKYYGEQWDRFSRDGVMAETIQRSGFKCDAKGHTRRANRKFCHKVLKGEDYDDEAYPRYHDAKYLAWNWW